MFFPHQVALSDAKFTDGESIMGDASTYRVKCGTISFENLLGLRFGDEQDEFLVTSSGPVPATPGAILVPWCEAFPKFHGDEQKSVLARNVEQRHSYLDLFYSVNSGQVGSICEEACRTLVVFTILCRCRLHFDI